VGLWITDEAVAAGFAEQVIDRLADILGVGALDRGGATADEGGAGEGGHGGRIAAGGPVAEGRLVLGDPLEAAFDGLFDFGVAFGGLGGVIERRNEARAGERTKGFKCLTAGELQLHERILWADGKSALLRSIIARR